MSDEYERAATAQIKADRLELEAQAHERHSALLTWASHDHPLLHELVKLHAPEPDTYEMVSCTGCPPCYDSSPRWPCLTFVLIENSV